jgi:uncharacterized protein YfaA (DUF2138 family)
LQARIRTALERLGALAITAAIAAVAVIAARSGHVRYGGAIEGAGIDLGVPDAYIATPALSRLPNDLVKAPLARELLTEDFAFYYEEHEDRLGVQGALKRIAYEHDVTLSDRLLALALDEPAEVALWKDAKGAPRYWLIAMTRGTLAKALQQAAQLAANDRQLTVLGELPDADGSTPVYALSLSSRRTLALVARGNRVVVLSDPGLLFDDQRQVLDPAAKIVTSLLSGEAADQALYRRHFGLTEHGSDHVLVADSSLLSFGYRHFFPGLRALQLDVPQGGGELRMQLRIGDSGTLPSRAAADTLWAGVPMGAAACTWLPADWTRARAVLERIGRPPGADGSDASPANEATPSDDSNGTEAPSDEAGQDGPTDSQKSDGANGPKPAKGPTARGEASTVPGGPALTGIPAAEARREWARFAANLDGPAAICWYARSQFHTPLIVARTRADAPADVVDRSLARIGAWLVPNGVVELPRGAKSRSSARRWQQEVAAPWGAYGGEAASLYRPTLAHDGAWISFSPDDTLVDLALSTQERRYPGMAETLPRNGATLAVLAPAQLADLVQREAFAVLPPQQELLRQAAEQHLLPRLETLRHWPAVRAVATGSPSSEGWVPIAWQPLEEASGDSAAAPAAGHDANR